MSSQPPLSSPQKVYRVVSYTDWLETQQTQRVPRCGADDRDGFVHLSTAETMLETANLYFTPEEQPLILEIATERLGEALRWEEVAHRDGQRFPHYYAPHIPAKAITHIQQLTINADQFSLGFRTSLETETN